MYERLLPTIKQNYARLKEEMKKYLEQTKRANEKDN